MTRSLGTMKQSKQKGKAPKQVEPKQQEEEVAPSCFSVKGANGISLHVSVVPNAKCTESEGVIEDGALRVRLAAPPVDGKANAELIDWLSGELRVPKKCVVVATGQTSRKKRLDVEVDPAIAKEWLEKIVVKN